MNVTTDTLRSTDNKNTAQTWMGAMKKLPFWNVVEYVASNLQRPVRKCNLQLCRLDDSLFNCSAQEISRTNTCTDCVLTFYSRDIVAYFLFCLIAVGLSFRAARPNETQLIRAVSRQRAHKSRATTKLILICLAVGLALISRTNQLANCPLRRNAI